jgi:hypothetical protein
MGKNRALAFAGIAMGRIKGIGIMDYVPDKAIANNPIMVRLRSMS